MTTWLTRCFAMLLLLLPFAPAVADDPDDAEIARLVKQLGSSDFRTREAASKELVALGEPARAALRKVAASNADLESGKDSRSFEGHTAGVDAIALSADGKKCLSGSYDTTVDCGTTQPARS